jgi:hypothetical protein
MSYNIPSLLVVIVSFDRHEFCFLTPPRPSIVQTYFPQIQITNIDSSELALKSDSSSLDSGSNSNSTGFFQPGNYGTIEYQGRETPMSFVKENSLIRDRFGSRMLAHLLIARAGR